MTYLDLNRYRSAIKLDKSFLVHRQIIHSETELDQLLDKLLSHLYSENILNRNSFNINSENSSYIDKQNILRRLLTIRGPEPLPSWFHENYNIIKQYDLKNKALIDSASLQKIKDTLPGTGYRSSNNTALWKGDITKLKIDAIVNAANDKMLGCFQPHHTCIDNAIHSAAGPMLREDCNKIMELQGTSESKGLAKITRGYNLPSKYVLHTVGPIIYTRDGLIKSEEKKGLALCYISCLNLAAFVPGIKSVALCCISTGVFGFPQEPAAEIALKTVDKWMTDNPGKIDLVVFNIFTERDYNIYEKLLINW